MYYLIGRGAYFVFFVFCGFRVRVREGFLKSLKGLEVALVASLNGFFYAVVTGNSNGIALLHGCDIRLMSGGGVPECKPVLCDCFLFKEREKLRGGFALSNEGEVAEE